MDDRAQLSLEYLIMVALSIALAAIAILLAGNLFSLKQGLKDNIHGIRDKAFSLVG